MGGQYLANIVGNRGDLGGFCLHDSIFYVRLWLKWVGLLDSIAKYSRTIGTLSL